MQTIIHSQPNIHPIFDEFDRVYSLTSNKTNKSLVPYVFSPSFKSIFDVFYTYGNVSYTKSYVKRDYKPIDISKNENTVVVCVSGGKDSIATVLYFRKRGYNIIMYHLRGINYTYKDEYKAVQILADKLHLPLVIEDVTLKGKQDWVEHPLKNMIIANMALQYAIRNKLGKRIAFGNFSSSSLNCDPFEVCGGDCAEMWEVYTKIIRGVIPRFNVLTPLENFQDTIDLLLYKPKLLPYIQSCIGAYRYREKLRKYNQQKYNIELPEHRCGSCWKCCLEYCVFCDKGVYEYNEKYYLHCLSILQGTLNKETGMKNSLYDVFNHYFFYSLSKSHCSDFI